MRLCLAAAALLLPLLAACGPPCTRTVCGACAPALTLGFVDDATGVALAGATIDHPSGRCDESAGTTRCWIDDVGQGSVHFVASAPGYAGKNVETTVPILEDGGCCSCGYEPQTLEIRLTTQ